MSFVELLKVVSRVLGYIKPYWKVVLGAFFLTLFVTLARLSQAKFVGLIFGLMTEDKFTYADGQDPFWRLNLICALFLGVMVVMGVGTYFQKYLVDLGGQSAIRDFRNHVFCHLQKLSLPFYDEMRLGEIQSRCSGDIMTATSIYTILADFLKNFLIVVVAMGWMLYQDWQMTCLVLLLSPIIGGAVSRFGKKMGKVTEKLQARVADLSAIMYENISSIKVVKAYNREDFEIARYTDKNEENFSTQMKLVQVVSMQSPAVEFLGALGIVAIIWFGATRILQGAVTFSQMTEYWTLLVMTSQPINALSGFYSNFQAAAAAAKRVFYILDREPEVKEKKDAFELPPIKGEIRFEKVCFGYKKGVEVLHDISITVSPGEVLAIVGANGAGKTSFVNLIPRFYDPSRGRVLIDGYDIRDVTLKSLRSQIGVVIQESVLFGGTVAENIACGDHSISREQIVEAAKVARAHDFIVGLPHQYDTQIGERGMRLSGGQRQRIAIARAFVRNPRILILDEFTSGIDPESEHQIAQALEKVMKGRTCIVIAHRLNTIRNADRIIVLDQGRIKEMGSHDELLAAGGLYTRLYEAQLRAPMTFEAKKGA